MQRILVRIVLVDANIKGFFLRTVEFKFEYLQSEKPLIRKICFTVFALDLALSLRSAWNILNKCIAYPNREMNGIKIWIEMYKLT